MAIKPELAPDWQQFAPEGHWLQVDIERQQVYVIRKAEFELCFPVSTALNGVGEEEGSGCTPLGWHTVRAKIGVGNPANAVYRGRRWTGVRAGTATRGACEEERLADTEAGGDRE